MFLGRVYQVPVMGSVSTQKYSKDVLDITYNAFTIQLVKATYNYIQDQYELEYSLNGSAFKCVINAEIMLCTEAANGWLAKKLAGAFYEIVGTEVNPQYLAALDLSTVEDKAPSGWVNAGYTAIDHTDDINGYETVLSYYDEVTEWTAKQSLSDMSHELPGINTKVKYPCQCRHDKDDEVFSIIIHLNDKVHWTREQIADWLDELADSGQISIDFEVDTGIGDDLEKEIENANID